MIRTNDSRRTRIAIATGDVLTVLRQMPSDICDGCLFDGPYALTSIGKRFGKTTSKPLKTDEGSNGVYGRMARGFMGQSWDGNLPSVEVYQELLRVCKSGSWMLAFGHPPHSTGLCAISKTPVGNSGIL